MMSPPTSGRELFSPREDGPGLELARLIDANLKSAFCTVTGALLLPPDNELISQRIMPTLVRLEVPPLSPRTKPPG